MAEAAAPAPPVRRLDYATPTTPPPRPASRRMWALGSVVVVGLLAIGPGEPAALLPVAVLYGIVVLIWVVYDWILALLGK